VHKQLAAGPLVVELAVEAAHGGQAYGYTVQGHALELEVWGQAAGGRLGSFAVVVGLVVEAAVRRRQVLLLRAGLACSDRRDRGGGAIEK
jgi:hypothetical protein